MNPLPTTMTTAARMVQRLAFDRAAGARILEGPNGTPAGRFRPQVVLTFDDGPGQYTEDVLSVLRRHRAKGTFFVVGAHVRGQERLLRRMVREGHEIGNHSFTHARLVEEADPAAEIERTSAEIARATGVAPRLFRPPYLAFTAEIVQLAHATGLTTLLWTIDSRDWSPTQDRVRMHREVTDSVVDGSIVLLHDGISRGGQTARALDAILATLAARGYAFPTASELLERPTPPRELARYTRIHPSICPR